MNTVALQTYTDYSAYMNKDNIIAHNKQINQVQNDIVKEEENLKVEQVNESRKLTNEEAVAMFYNYSAAQATKSMIDTLLETPNEEEQQLSYQDIRDVNKKINRIEYLENYKNEYASVQVNKSHLEIWA